MTTPAYSWVCAGCGRRVPARILVCHCGLQRPQQTAPSWAPRAAPFTPASGWRGVWRTMPGDVRAIAVTAAVVLVAGLATLALVPAAPRGGAALLGYVERPYVPPAEPRPAFKLPWWK